MYYTEEFWASGFPVVNRKSHNHLRFLDGRFFWPHFLKAAVNSDSSSNLCGAALLTSIGTGFVLAVFFFFSSFL